MIQLIVDSSYKWNQKHDLEKYKNIKVSDISNPHSFDQYEVNIINLNDRNIWRHDGGTYTALNCQNDFKSLGTIMANSKKAKILILLPQDLQFQYEYHENRTSYSGNNGYRKFRRLKDMLLELKKNLLSSLIQIPYDLVFENTSTLINGNAVYSSFYFDVYSTEDSITQSQGSNKTTTISMSERLFMSTLNLDDIGNLKGFLSFLGLIKEKEKSPEWINDVEFFDDIEQKETVASSYSEIERLKKEIEKSEKKLAKNSRYKSILYTNGQELVDVVFEMLENMLEYDLNEFIDAKKEDFILKWEDVTFIGEIKGVTSNIRSEYISQLDVHYHGYVDKLFEEERHENVKAILIINHQRNKNIKARQPVHAIQMQLAERNGSLIIESSTLLNLFEQYLREEITVEEIKELLIHHTGLLKNNLPNKNPV